MSFLKSLLNSDRAENSIMQTITIAVSAILIAAGLVTAPGLINNARDNNARTDLANIAYAQEFVLSVGGKYYEHITPEQEELATGQPSTGDNLQDAAEEAGLNGAGTSWGSAATAVEGQTGIKFTLSGDVTGHKAATCATPAFYILKAQSKSSKWFYRASGSATTSSNLGEIEVPVDVLNNCPDILDGFEGDDDTDTPTGPQPDGDDIPIPAGAGKLDLDVHSFHDNNYAFGISGYNENDTSHENFGGGNTWTPKIGEEISLSYFDPATTSLVEFLSESWDGASKAATVAYDDYSGRLYGNYESALVDASNNADFGKLGFNGGSMTFVSSETDAEVTVVWYPPTPGSYEWYPTFPTPAPAAEYRDLWEHVDGDSFGTRAADFDNSSNGNIIFTAYIYSHQFNDGEIGTLRASTDAGASSFMVATPDGMEYANWKNVQVSANGNTWYLANDTELWRTNNQGSSWTQINVGNGGIRDFEVNAAGTKVVTGGANGELTVWTIGGTSVGTNVDTDGMGTTALNFAWSSDGKLWVADQYGSVRYSTNDGSSFTTVDELGTASWRDIAVSADGSTIVIGVTSNSSKFFISHDNGATWQNNTGGLGYGWVTNAKVSADGQDILIAFDYSGASKELHVSHDGGASWTKQDSAGVKDFQRVGGSDDFSKIYAQAAGSSNGYNNGIWRHIAGETECYAYCEVDNGGGNGDM